MLADAAGQANLTISGTAADSGGSGVAEVRVLVDGVPGAVMRLADDWSQWKAEVALSGLGAHVITAEAFDGAGLSMDTTLNAQVVADTPKPPLSERLMLVEKYQLASYNGANAPGKIIKVISLLPGQKTTITSKTYKRSTETATQASSMLDSYTAESQSDFEDTLTREQSNKHSSDESSKWSIEGSATASWGFGSADIKAGASAGTNAAREEMAKNVASAVQKHAAKASSKRDIDVKTGQEDKTEVGDESSSQDVIENINVSRTLNFIFRQAEQEFLTFLLLTDVRVAYVRLDEPDGSLYTLALSGSAGDTFTLGVRDRSTAALPMDATASEIEAALQALGTEIVGVATVTAAGPGRCTIEFDRPDIGLSVTVLDGSGVDGQHAGADLRRQTSRATYQEVTLSQLNGLLTQVLVPERIAEVHDEIVAVLSNVFDCADEPHAMVEEKVLVGPDGAPLPNGTYLRFPKNKTSTYVDATTGLELVVPGVILSVMRTMLCADGVFCDLRLGGGDGLDAYSQGLQDVSVAAKRLENDAKQLEIDRERAALALVEQGNADAVGLYHQAFVVPTVSELALAPAGAAASNGDRGQD